jgi:hypothetical protein
MRLVPLGLMALTKDSGNIGNDLQKPFMQICKISEDMELMVRSDGGFPIRRLCSGVSKGESITSWYWRRTSD